MRSLQKDLEVSCGDGDAIGGKVHAPGVGDVVRQVLEGALACDIVLGHVADE